MVQLEFLTSDARLIDLAEAYWSLDETAKWRHKISELVVAYSLPSNRRLHEDVARVCIASSTEYRCSVCGDATKLESRARLEALRRQARWQERAGAGRRVCDDCRAHELASQQAEIRRQARAKVETIEAWLSLDEQRNATIDYGALKLKEHFLLYGLLRHARGHWRGAHLDSWAYYRPLLCGSAADIRSVYQTLNAAKLIIPRRDSPIDAFDVKDGEVVIKDELHVNWLLAGDRRCLPHSALLEVADNIQRGASHTEFHEVWEWVCPCELRGLFEYHHDEYNFRSRGWTSRIEDCLRKLIMECPLGAAKRVVSLCFKSIAAELQKRKYPPPHIYNMLPGSFERTFNLHRESPWFSDISTQVRSTPEPIYTAHLFDKVFKERPMAYHSLTGNDFNQVRNIR